MTCQATHPKYDTVICEEETSGPNARAQAVHELDEEGNPKEVEPARDVHVHKGYVRNDEGVTTEVCRWES